MYFFAGFVSPLGGIVGSQVGEGLQVIQAYLQRVIDIGERNPERPVGLKRGKPVLGNGFLIMFVEDSAVSIELYVRPVVTVIFAERDGNFPFPRLSCESESEFDIGWQVKMIVYLRAIIGAESDYFPEAILFEVKVLWFVGTGENISMVLRIDLPGGVIFGN